MAGFENDRSTIRESIAIKCTATGLLRCYGGLNVVIFDDWLCAYLRFLFIYKNYIYK